MQIKWKVQLFKDGKEHYELSVIKLSNKFGQKFWGWGDENKIILFGTNLGENTHQNQKKAKKIANIICDALNKMVI